jgi:hypothetical protein
MYASHTYQEQQAYKTGAYIGKAAFAAAEFQNQHCLHACEPRDLNQDSVMEDALASANIIPALADSTALRTGFRDAWRESRSSR